jgi:hypothetical protein
MAVQLGSPVAPGKFTLDSVSLRTDNTIATNRDKLYIFRDEDWRGPARNKMGRNMVAILTLALLVGSSVFSVSKLLFDEWHARRPQNRGN